jgi:hypothetical protein
MTGEIMEPDLHILYRLLRPAALRGDLITYGTLSQQYEQLTGDAVDPHFGWRMPLARIDFRCVGLCRPGHRPILSAIVVTDPEGQTENPGRPGQGFWDLYTPDGVQLTPDVPSEDEWVAMCGAVYRQVWPDDLDGLPA